MKNKTIGKQSVIYEDFHSNIKPIKKIISSGNFTYRFILKLTERYLKNVENVIDIGCGVGMIDLYIAAKGIKVTGIDVSKLAINGAKSNSTILKIKNTPDFICGDFMKIKLKSKYDMILISEVLEHLEDDDRAVKKINSLLKNKGIVIASSPSSIAPLYRLGLLKDFDLRVGHLRRYTEKTFAYLFESNGFKVLKIFKTEGILRNFLYTNNFGGIFIKFIRGPISDVVTFIDNLTIPIFGESNYYIVAKKI